MTAQLLLVLALLFSPPFVSQGSSDVKNEEDITHVSQAFHVFLRGGDRNLLQNFAFSLSQYFNDRFIDRGYPIARAPTLAPSPAPSGYLDCDELCVHRCSLHSRQNVCLRACGTCCLRCKCVPPGTYGNREMCGKCYADMTTHGNKTKCP